MLTADGKAMGHGLVLLFFAGNHAFYLQINIVMSSTIPSDFPFNQFWGDDRAALGNL